MVPTPTSLRIRALHAEAHTIFAGADMGILLSGRLEGNDWTQLALPVADASILYIGRLPGSEELLVVLQTPDRFVGLSTSRSAPGQWSEQFSRPRPLFANDRFDAQGAVYVAGEQLVLVSGSAESKLEVLAHDRNARAWKPSMVGGDGLPFSWAALPDGSFGRFRGIPLTGMYFAMSKDQGATWEKRGELNWTTGSLLFVSERTGYVLRTDLTPLRDPSKLVVSVWRTDDAGRNWTMASPAPAAGGKFVPLAQPDQVGFAGVDGRFFSSTDGGNTWRLERELR